MASLTIARDSGYVDWLRPYSILLDGNSIGELKDGEVGTFTIPAGQHELVAEIGMGGSTISWYGSKQLTFIASDDNEAKFSLTSNARGVKIILRLWHALIARDRYLRLEQVSDLSELIATPRLVALSLFSFILRFGVLGFGALGAAILLLWRYFNNQTIDAPIIAITVIGWPVAGAVWGAFMWWWSKRRYATKIAAKNLG